MTTRWLSTAPRLVAGGLGILAFLQSAPSRAQSPTPRPPHAAVSVSDTVDLKPADRLYDDGEFEAAAKEYQAFLDQHPGASLAHRSTALERLGICLTLLRREDAARPTFLRLLEIDPTHRLDELSVLPEVVNFYEAIRSDFMQRQPLPELRRTQPFAYSLLPLGAGQFFNDQTTKGIALLGAEAAAVGLSAFSYSKKKTYCREYQDGVCLTDEASQHRRWETAQKTSAFLAAGLFIYGLVDGILFFQEKETPISWAPVWESPDAFAVTMQIKFP